MTYRLSIPLEKRGRGRISIDNLDISDGNSESRTRFGSRLSLKKK